MGVGWGRGLEEEEEANSTGTWGAPGKTYVSVWQAWLSNVLLWQYHVYVPCSLRECPDDSRALSPGFHCRQCLSAPCSAEMNGTYIFMENTYTNTSFLPFSVTRAGHARTHADTPEHAFTYWDHFKNQKDVHPFTLLGTLFKPIYIYVCVLSSLIFVHTRMYVVFVFHCLYHESTALTCSAKRIASKDFRVLKNTHSHPQNSIFLRWPSPCRELVSVNAVCLSKEISFTSLAKHLLNVSFSCWKTLIQQSSC